MKADGTDQNFGLRNKAPLFFTKKMYKFCSFK